MKMEEFEIPEHVPIIELFRAFAKIGMTLRSTGVGRLKAVPVEYREVLRIVDERA